MSGGFTGSLVTTSLGVNPDWAFLASEHGMHKRAGATFDALLVAADGDGNKVIDAGTVVAEVTATGKWAPYDDAETDGREVAKGIILPDINLKDGDTIAGVLIHGSVIEARVTGVDAAAKVDLGDAIIWQ